MIQDNPTPARETCPHAMQVPTEVVSAVRDAQRSVCIGHVTPDADCIGSLLALTRALNLDGLHGATACLPEHSISRRLAFMVPLADVKPAGLSEFNDTDACVVLDTAKLPRCNLIDGLAENWSDKPQLINIDHHATNTRFGNVNWIEEHVSSTSEMVLALMQQLNLPIDPPCATLLYAGMYTDTAGFSLPTTTGATLHAAAELLGYGANLVLLGERLFRSLAAGEFGLLQTIYANTRLAAGNRIAYSTADYDEIRRAGCTARDIDDQVTVPRSLSGIELAILMTEGKKGRVRLNFRGENGTEVLELARMFSGGGHRSAAGAVLSCSLQEAVDRVLPVAIEYLDRKKQSKQPSHPPVKG